MAKMRNTGTRGYSGYRGRTEGSHRWVIAVLLALIILAAATFLAAQHFRVYRSDGSSYIELPWFRDAEPARAPDAPPVETAPAEGG